MIKRTPDWAQSDLALLEELSRNKNELELSLRAEEALSGVNHRLRFGAEVLTKFSDVEKIMAETNLVSAWIAHGGRSEKTGTVHRSKDDSEKILKKINLINDIVKSYETKNITSCIDFLIEAIKDESKYREKDMKDKTDGSGIHKLLRHDNLKLLNHDNLPACGIQWKYINDLAVNYILKLRPEGCSLKLAKLFASEIGDSIKIKALDTLIRLGEKIPANEIHSILNSKDALLKIRVFKMLAQSNSKEIAKVIAEYLKDSDMKLHAAWALMNMDAKEYAREIFTIITATKVPSNIIPLIDKLIEWKESGLTGQIEALLSNPDKEIKSAAQKALDALKK